MHLEPLLLDTNDELRNGAQLRKCAEEYVDNPSSGFLLCQEWFSGSYDILMFDL